MTQTSKKFKFLNEAELLKIKTNFSNNRKRKKVKYTEYELLKVYEWCDETVLRFLMLRNILDDYVNVDLAVGEEITFSGTDKLKGTAQSDGPSGQSKSS